MNNIFLRPANQQDIAVIQQWPAYPEEFTELEYALRNNGWLDEFSGKSDTWIYVAENNGDILAFLIIAKTSPTDAEFRIALHPQKNGTVQIRARFKNGVFWVPVDEPMPTGKRQLIEGVSDRQRAKTASEWYPDLNRAGNSVRVQRESGNA